MLPSRISGDGIIVAAANEQCDYIYLDNRVCNRGIRDDLDGPVAISKIPVPNSEIWQNNSADSSILEGFLET